MIRDELRALWKNKLLMFVLCVIALIPSIYAGIFLASMWDPYGDVDCLPVAVVNHDQPYEFDGKTLKIGEELAEELEDSDDMAFQVVDEDVAETGLEKGTFYMVITIPKDFSYNASTLMDDHPKKMELSYKTNPGTNYIASKLSGTAIKTLKDKLVAKVTKTYAEKMFDSLEEVEDGFGDAVEGSDKMLDGEDELISGNSKIKKNLKKLAESTLVFADGSETLETGISKYTDGVDSAADGADTLNAASKQLSSGISSLSEGTSDLKDGTSAVLSGLTTMSDTLSSSMTDEKVQQIQTAAAGLKTYDENMQAFNTAIQNAGSGAGTALQGTAQDIQTSYGTMAALYQSGTLNDTQKATLKAAMDALYNAENPTSTDTALGKLMAAKEGLSGIDQLKEASAKLAASSTALMGPSSDAMTGMLGAIQSVQTGLDMKAETSGQSGLIEGMTAVDGGLSKLQAGIDGENGLASGFNTYSAGVASLSKGLNTLNDNSSTLVAGSSALTNGANQIADGSSKLYDGSKSLGKGLNKLKDGTDELRDGLAEGKDKVHDNEGDDETTEMFSKPLETKETQITRVENNGHAMAAYMMTVGLWVAALAFCLIYPLYRYRRLRNGIGWWASKAIILYPLAAIMAVVLVGVLHLALGFDPVDLKGTIITAIVTGIAFMSIMYFFNALLGKAGSFLMLVTMVLQLAGSAGTYPVELSGEFAAALHKWMPFTYSVDAFRSTISGGQDITLQLQVLGGLAIVFSILIMILFAIRTYLIKHNKRFLYQWIEEKGFA